MARSDPASSRPGSPGPPFAVFDVHTHAFPDDVARKAIPKLEEAALWFPCPATHDGTVRGLLATEFFKKQFGQGGD